MPVTNPIARPAPFNYEALKGLSPSQVRARVPAAAMSIRGYPNQAFDWDEFHRVTDNFWLTHNDDAVRSEIRGPGFSGPGYDPPSTFTPPTEPNPITRDPATIPQGDPVVSKPPETPSVTLSPVPAPSASPPAATTPDASTIVTNPAAVSAQRNLQRFANDPVLGQVFKAPAQGAPAAVAAPAATAPLVFQNEDELLAAAMDIIARLRQPAAAVQPTLGATSLSTAPYIAPAALKTDPFGIAASAQSQPKAATPMTLAAPAATSSGLGATTSGAASPGLGLGARVSGIFNDERTMANG